MAKPRKTTTTGRLLGIALEEGRRFAKQGFDRRVKSAGYTDEDVQAATVRKGIVQWIAAAALTRLATRSLPGALAVGGAVVAKALLDRRKSAGDTGETPEAVDDRTA
jgi:hypothetical protein